MSEERLKLTAYFGERDRARGAFLADALLDCFGRRELEAGVVIRGVEGFGLKHHLRTDRLLSLSEDLPMVAVAVDTRERVEAALPEVAELASGGLITLERARTPGAAAPAHDAATKLTLYLGRGERIAGRPGHLAVVDLLHRHGVAGATVLLGVDGTARGVRHRARFFAANADVPLMVVAIGDGAPIARALAELAGLLPRPLATLERVDVLKRDGVRLAQLRHVPESDESGLQLWQLLSVYCSEQSRHGGRPLYQELIRRLRREGAAGATAMRGIWGYHGDHAPHGDSFWQLRRRVPMVTVLVDTPANARGWLAVVDELTDETGLVTSEVVPALRSSAPGVSAGGLRLAARRP